MKDLKVPTGTGAQEAFMKAWNRFFISSYNEPVTYHFNGIRVIIMRDEEK